MEIKSHLTRGAWIEISPARSFRNLLRCRTSHEVRGLKSLKKVPFEIPQGVAPHTRCVD